MNPSKLTQTCHYNILPTSRSIRLLGLQASSDGKIEITLHTHSLDTAPPFTAVSYTWGNPYRDLYSDDIEKPPEFLARISCNGKQVAVTQNLFDALTTFVYLNMLTFLWVDAVCINQSDLEERASQVTLMGDIYSMAHEVVVWLGPHREDAADFLWATTDFLATVQSSDSSKKPKSIFSPGNIHIREFWPGLELEDPLPRLLRFVFFYSSCRWFTRAWTLQEVVLAQQARMFCGKTEVSLQKAVELVTIIRTLGWDAELSSEFSRFYQIFPVKDLLLELPVLEYASSLVNNYLPSFEREESRWKHGAEPIWALSSILLACRQYKCHEKRDKIYSALGIVSKAFPNNPITKAIVPNYTVTVEKVFIDATILILEYSRTLDYLSDTRHRVRQRQQMEGLHIPSWVHDYSVPYQAYSLAYRNLRFDAALCETSSFPTFNITGSAIICYGTYFDTIEEIQGSTLEEIEGPGSQPLLEFFQFYLELRHQLQGRPRLEVLWRTMIVNYHRDTEAPPPPSFELPFVAWMKSKLMLMFWRAKKKGKDSLVKAASVIKQLRSNVSSKEPTIVQELLDRGLLFKTETGYDHIPDIEETDAEEQIFNYHYTSSEYNRLYSRVVSNRRLFITKWGFLGLGVETVQKGDQVWLLCDAHTPFVMQTTPKPSSFTVVGDCYIHDFMHGEMLDDRWGVKENIGPIKIV